MADFDYKKMRDYVSADPEVTKLREKRTTSYKKIDSLKESARKNIEKMHQNHQIVHEPGSGVSVWAETLSGCSHGLHEPPGTPPDP